MKQPRAIAHPGRIVDIHRKVRAGRLDPQVALAHEYASPHPRWSLITWLKRNGARPATTRTLHAKAPL